VSFLAFVTSGFSDNMPRRVRKRGAFVVSAAGSIGFLRYSSTGGGTEERVAVFVLHGEIAHDVRSTRADPSHLLFANTFDPTPPTLAASRPLHACTAMKRPCFAGNGRACSISTRFTGC